MVELCLMASSTYPSVGIFRQEQQGLRRTNKEVRTFFSSPGTRQEVTRLGSLHLRPDHLEYPWQPTGPLLFSDNSIKLDSIVGKPVLIDVQGARPDSGLFTSGIAEQRRRHAKIWQFFMSGSSEAEREELDFSLQSDFMGLQTLALMPPHPQVSLYSDLSPYNVGPDYSQPSLIYPRSEFYPHKPFLDFIGNLDCSSKISMHPDGRILFTGTGSEMKDLLSLVAEFSLSKNSTDWRTRALLVPQMTRPSRTETRTDTHQFVLRPKAVTATPLKSPRKTKQKQSSKRKTSKKAKKDLSGSNYSHAGESLLNLIFSERRGKEAILSLKKSGRELPELLTQFSAGLAGTGIAVLLFVACRLTSGRVPFCNIRALNTVFGFGLFWLSRGVYVLRNNISYFTEKSLKSDWKDEMMMMKRVDKSLKEVFLRAATLLAVGLLRVA